MENLPNEYKPEEIKYFILNATEPIVFKNKLKWELINWSLQDWSKLLGEKKLNFRCGSNKFTRDPQWERTTSQLESTMNDFVPFSNNASESWRYFDYKYLRDWFTDIELLKTDIDWSFFGFPEIKTDDCTIWMGSKGAHTPCHADTYGCNLIAQVYGKKQWILFPPEENLKPTRIPYEESSIYSKLNFFSPTLQHFRGVSNCRKVVLEPGDVLLLPHKWWHYVENLETAISINTWIPLPQDNEQRLSESLVQYFVSNVAKNVNESVQKTLLNPNCYEISTFNHEKSVGLINATKKLCITNSKKRRSEVPSSKLIEEFTLMDIELKYSFLQKIPIMPKNEFNLFIEAQKNRFGGDCDDQTESDSKDVSDLINAITDQAVIKLITKKLLEQ